MDSEKYFIRAVCVLTAVILFFTVCIFAGFVYINSNVKAFSEAADNTANNSTYEPPTKTQIPILMYHNFVIDTKDITEMSMDIDRFKQDMEYLKRNGYKTIFSQDLIDYVYDGVPLPKNKPSHFVWT